MAESAASPRRITAAEKRRKALRLKKSGMGYDEIANAVGYANRGTAYKAVMQELRNLPRPDAAELLTLELERTEALILALWTPAMKGDPAAHREINRHMERRARLLGLDSATKLHHSAEEAESVIGSLLDAIRLEAGPPPTDDDDEPPA